MDMQPKASLGTIGGGHYLQQLLAKRYPYAPRIGREQAVRDGRRGINQHTSPDYQSASLGCQNMPIQDYVAHMKDIGYTDNNNNNKILYTLIDSSKINSIKRIVL